MAGCQNRGTEGGKQKIFDKYSWCRAIIYVRDFL